MPNSTRIEEKSQVKIYNDRSALFRRAWQLYHLGKNRALVEDNEEFLLPFGPCLKIAYEEFCDHDMWLTVSEAVAMLDRKKTVLCQWALDRTVVAIKYKGVWFFNSASLREARYSPLIYVNGGKVSSAAEWAFEKGVSDRTVRNWINSGKLKGFKHMGTWYLTV